MNTKTWMGAAVIGGLLAWSAGAAWAVDPDQDSLTIRIQPSVDYGVDMDTATTKMDTGTDLTTVHALTLNATHYFITPATVTIKGNFNNQEVSLQAAGLDQWGIDENEVIEPNAVQVYALFAVGRSSQPLESEFGSDSGRHQVKGLAATFAGESSGSENGDRADNYYEIPGTDMTGGANMDNLQVGNERQLWLRLDTPSHSNWDTEQRIRVTVTAALGTVN